MRLLPGSLWCYFLLYLGVIACASQGSEKEIDAKAEHTIPICVDPSIELVCVIHRLAGTHQYHESQLPKYIRDVEGYFDPHRDHRAVHLARFLDSMHHINGSAPMALAVYLGAPPDIREYNNMTPPPGDLDPRWTEDILADYIHALRDFARDSRFMEFYRSHENDYSNATDQLHSTIQNVNIMQWCQQYFGYAPDQYKIILGMQNGSCNYGMQITQRDGTRQFISILGARYPSVRDIPKFPPDLYIPTIIHEFCHSYINPLVDSSRHAFQLAGEKIYPHHQDQLKQAGYNYWYVMLYEYIVRACVVRYLIEMDGPDVANERMSWDASFGFPGIYGLVDLLEHYETNRDRYPRLDDFVPHISRYFEQLARDYDEVKI